MGAQKEAIHFIRLVVAELGGEPYLTQPEGIRPEPLVKAHIRQNILKGWRGCFHRHMLLQ